MIYTVTDRGRKKHYLYYQGHNDIWFHMLAISKSFYAKYVLTEGPKPSFWTIIKR